MVGTVSLEADRVVVLMVATDDFTDEQVDRFVELAGAFAHEATDVPEVSREDGAVFIAVGPEPLGSERTAAFVGWAVHTVNRIEIDMDISVVVEVSDLRTDIGR